MACEDCTERVDLEGWYAANPGQLLEAIPHHCNQ